MIADIIKYITIDDILDENNKETLLKIFGIADPNTIKKIFRRMEGRDRAGFYAIFPFLMAALGDSADPIRSLINFERYFESFGTGLFKELEKIPRVIDVMITIFSTSPFLTEILIHEPEAFSLLSDRSSLTGRKTIEQFQAGGINTVQSNQSIEEKQNELRRYQRRQLLRIGTCDFLGLYDLGTVLSQLSKMAIGLVRACLFLATQETGISADGFVVLAMGKLGGWELNYSSDIDLVFISRKNPEKYTRLAEKFISNVASITPEGFLYRVDLRLRPWGNDGPLIATPEGYLEYIKKNARLWEKQAFLKARSIAGNLSLGEELRYKIEPFLFRAPSGEVRASIYAMKQQTEEMLQAKGRQWGEVKLGKGSIRDIEFVVQSLQLVHPSVRTRATLKAIRRLREDGLVNLEEEHVLFDGYHFLRTIEHYLQIIDFRQTDSLPSDEIAITLLARRLGFEGPQAGKQFLESYKLHCQTIRAVFMKYVGNVTENVEIPAFLAAPIVLNHVSQMDSSYATTFSQEEIQEHAQLASRITSNSLAIVDAKKLDEERWKVTVVGYDYLGELSLICGLLFIYGLDIVESQIFTYEPIENDLRRCSSTSVNTDPTTPKLHPLMSSPIQILIAKNRGCFCRATCENRSPIS